MKRILGWNEWHIHPFTLLYLVVSFLTDNIGKYLMALSIVCIHEMFHYVFAKLFHFDIIDVEVLPFGAFLNLQDYGMHHIIEEMVMILAGLCSHFFMYLIIMRAGGNIYLLEVNTLVFVFNMLPIYPLDGSKMLLLILSLVMDYQKAIRTQIKISILALSIVIVIKPVFSHIVVYVYLLYLNYQYIKEYRVMLIRLYMDRMRGSVYRKYKIHRTYAFYRPYRNVYHIDNCIMEEKEALQELIKRIKND